MSDPSTPISDASETSDAPGASALPGTSGADLDLLVNGEPERMPAGCTITQLLELQGLAGKRVAVAVNREVVPRSRHAETRVAPGDRIEILEAVGGG